MRLRNKSALTLLAVTLVLAGSALGAAANGETFSQLSATSGEVSWLTTSTADRISVRVSGPEVDFSGQFSVGDLPSFSLFDEEGNARPDGTYVFELREEFEAVNDTVRDPANGRDSAAHTDGAAIELAGRVEVGAFTIRDGAVVPSDLTEAPTVAKD